MSKIKTMGVSALSDTIYYGTLNTEKHMWVGKREDVTDEAIKAVFEWFMHKLDADEKQVAYQIKFPSLPYVLEMRKEAQDD